MVASPFGGSDTAAFNKSIIHLNHSSMISKKFPVFILFVLVLSFAAGCTAQRGDRGYVNVAGIYERQTHSYEAVPNATIPLRRIDVDPGADFSGNKTSLLWGLFTYYDY